MFKTVRLFFYYHYEIEGVVYLSIFFTSSSPFQRVLILSSPSYLSFHYPPPLPNICSPNLFLSSPNSAFYSTRLFLSSHSLLPSISLSSLCLTFSLPLSTSHTSPSRPIHTNTPMTGVLRSPPSSALQSSGLLLWERSALMP